MSSCVHATWEAGRDGGADLRVTIFCEMSGSFLLMMQGKNIYGIPPSYPIVVTTLPLASDETFDSLYSHSGLNAFAY